MSRTFALAAASLLAASLLSGCVTFGDDQDFLPQHTQYNRLPANSEAGGAGGN